MHVNLVPYSVNNDTLLGESQDYTESNKIHVTYSVNHITKQCESCLLQREP